MVNITLGGQRDQMASNRKKFSYLAIVAGAVMLSMTFISPPAFAAEGGESQLGDVEKWMQGAGQRRRE